MALKSFEETDRYQKKKKSDQSCPWRIMEHKESDDSFKDCDQNIHWICNRFKCL